MTQAQISTLFNTDRTSIGRHIRNVIKSSELSEKAVCAIFAHTAPDGKTYRVQYYNLDMILSVGYRVNSAKATQFRVWATQRLKEYLVKGYAINEQRLKDLENKSLKLKELQAANNLIRQVIEAKKSEGYEKELLGIITDYTNTWFVLNGYDEGKLKVEAVTLKTAKPLVYEDIQKSIGQFKKRLMAKKEASSLFGQEVGGKLKGALGSIHQTYNGKDLYASLEEKAAHLLYFCIKDHPFADGNKRIGSLLFLLFLIENNYLMNKKGERKINDSALAALALLIAESRPQEKEAIITLVVNLINRK